MGTLNTSGSYSHEKGDGASFDITMPAAAADALVALYIAGGAVPSTITLTDAAGPPLTRQTPDYSGGAQDTSIWDVSATGGETTIHVVLSGDDDVAGEWYQLAEGLEYVGGSHNGSGHSADVSTDFQIRPDAVTLPDGGGLLIVGFSVDTDVPYGVGNRWRGLGPRGHLYGEGGNQPGGSGVQMVWASGLADVEASTSWPQQNDPGDYAATSAWLGAGNCYAVQALYADSSGVPTYTADNDIAAENDLPGTHNSHWFLTTGTSAGICGFTGKASYRPGETVEFFVDSEGEAFQVEIYRVGYYGFETFAARNQTGCQGGYIAGTATTQPDPVVDPDLGSTSCPWTANATWTIPDDTATGVIYALVRRTDDTSKVAVLNVVIAGDPAGKIAVCLPDHTAEAYNPWGNPGDHGPRGPGGLWTGRNLYQDGADAGLPDITHRSYAVDFRRPRGIVDSQSSTYLADSELTTIVFLEAQGYDLTYLSNFDLDADPTILTRAKLVILLGHQEYWTQGIYDAITAARDARVNVLSTSSNTALWRTRFADDDVDRHTMICYKDSATADEGPNVDLPGTGFDPDGYTGTWRDTRTLAGGVNNPDIRSEDALTGQLFVASGPVQTTLSVPAAAKTMPIWRNSDDVQALIDDETYVSKANSLGFEADYPSGGPHQPTNLANLGPYDASFTTGANAAGSIYDTPIGPITLGPTMYRADSGALVVSMGTWRYWWTVSRWYGGAFAGNIIDANWQNALLCLLHDLGAVPAAVREMQPGIDPPLTDPAAGAPAGGRTGVAKAYGLTVPTSNGFFTFFT